MEIEEQLTFFIRNELNSSNDFVAQVPRNSTVGDLKKVIEVRLGIPEDRQKLEGWNSLPQDDQTILDHCSLDEVTVLTVSQLADMETEACANFLEAALYRPVQSIPFHSGSLRDLICENSLLSFEKRKIVLLYMHVEGSQFSKPFVESLIHPEVVPLIESNFTFLGWNIGDSKYHSALKKALTVNDLDPLCALVGNKICSANILLPLPNEGFTIFACIQKTFELDTFLMCLKGAQECFLADIGANVRLPDTNQVYDDDLELEACIKFVENCNRTRPKTVNFETERLQDVIKKAFGVPLTSRKLLLLYLNNPKDKFSKVFWENVMDENVIRSIEESFLLLAWDVEDSKYHNALNRALDNNELGILSPLVEKKICSAIIIAPIRDSYTTLACMRSTTNSSDFSDYIRNAQEHLRNEVEQETSLRTVEEERGSQADVDSAHFQTVMAERLGDRDYDCFEFNDEEYLKGKIAYALYGPPSSEEGYGKKEIKEAEKIYKAVKKSSNQIAEYKDEVQISFIYVCIEPLPAEKIKRANKDKEYNPKTDLMPLPIFVLRKCRESENPCRIFIDHTGRTYENWDEYIERNKLHACEMVLPKNGRYTFDENGKIILERHLSPACGVDAKVLQGFDIASTTTGVVSGGFLLVAALPTVAFPPAALLAAGLAGLGAGLYAVGRSSYALYDRSRHKQSMSILESEPRGAYLNIVAGALGFVGVGANVLVQQLVARGVNIAEAGIWTVNGIQIANIGASGVGLVNSGYEIVDQYFNNNQTPSALTIVQLGTSILFFGNAVFSFKSCGTLIEETQQQTLKNFNDSLRSNRHRKTFNKLVKSTISSNDGNKKAGMAEVISTIRKIPNKDEVFAVLTRANKQMNAKDIKFAAKDGQITLNDVPVNMSEFAAMSKGQRDVFLSDLRVHGGESPSEAVNTVSSSFSANGITYDVDVVNVVVKITAALSGNLKTTIIDIVSQLLCKITSALNQALDKLFPNRCKYAQLVDMVMKFISKEADAWETRYEEWTRTGNPELYSKCFDHVDVAETRRWFRFFEICAQICLNPSEAMFKSLLEYFHTWLAQKMCERQQKIEQDSETRAHSAKWRTKKVDCNICRGYYYNSA
ncbi:unnamed protein product [Callosobruchus maculatus]|uniref:Ubiquitin-like domain-containing protein n=1 Tax=Callosobruchus maculatus TaxID=64391 RepID=A0A653DRQ8_CALMS|nr:unnamed protein product [Callosobruchus maculatus]